MTDYDLDQLDDFEYSELITLNQHQWQLISAFIGFNFESFSEFCTEHGEAAPMLHESLDFHIEQLAGLENDGSTSY
jgi:hypothetical protein